MFIVLLVFAYAGNVERRQIIAMKVETPPKLDGRLDDPIWKKAHPSAKSKLKVDS